MGGQKRPATAVEREGIVYGDEVDSVTLREFKKLRLSDEQMDREGNGACTDNDRGIEQWDPSKALILLPVAPTEESFKLAVCADYKDTYLAQRLAQIHGDDIRRNILGNPPPSVDVINEENNSRGYKFRADPSDQQLVVYQPTLADLLKDASFYEEHRMTP
jgi:hypothetical protein